jgi:hypothetical protein
MYVGAKKVRAKRTSYSRAFVRFDAPDRWPRFASAFCEANLGLRHSMHPGASGLATGGPGSRALYAKLTWVYVTACTRVPQVSRLSRPGIPSLRSRNPCAARDPRPSLCAPPRYLCVLCGNVLSFCATQQQTVIQLKNLGAARSYALSANSQPATKPCQAPSDRQIRPTRSFRTKYKFADPVIFTPFGLIF